MVWLHGMHHGPIHVSELEKMQRRRSHGLGFRGFRVQGLGGLGLRV